MATPTGRQADTAKKISKEIATFLYGGTAVGQTGPGSYYNPNALQFNCVFVSIAFILGMTSPELSTLTGVPEPKQNMPETAIERLLLRLFQLGYIWDCAMTKRGGTPFAHGTTGHGGGDTIEAGHRLLEARANGDFGRPGFFRTTIAESGYYRTPYHLVLYERPDVNRTAHCIIHDEYRFTDYQHVLGKHEKDKGTDVGWEIEPDRIHLTISFLIISPERCVEKSRKRRGAK